MPKVLIIEDEPGVQMTIEDRLHAEGYEVEIRADGISGEAAALEGSYDVILLDLMLPGRDGFAVCQHIRQQGLQTPVLMLTARNTNLDVVMGLRQGADDYLAKPFDMGVLIARIEALMRRSRVLGSAQRISFGPFVLDREEGVLLKDGRIPVELNVQEYRLLEYLALHPDHTITRDQILDDVWGYGSSTTTRTVDVHIAKLRHRLGESDVPRHIQTVWGRGYKFIP
ncbi:MAG: response regulator transcription factor [Spirochaetia bacterium]|nr:response regulator transcription factor [Spirochaetia bacterium]MCF7942334.1 response regulator transcription factor [Spirochaetia bacterium]